MIDGNRPAPSLQNAQLPTIDLNNPRGISQQDILDAVRAVAFAEKAPMDERLRKDSSYVEGHTRIVNGKAVHVKGHVRKLT